LEDNLGVLNLDIFGKEVYPYCDVIVIVEVVQDEPADEGSLAHPYILRRYLGSPA
jgi:hypothetical protein